MTEQFYLMPPEAYTLYMQYKRICDQMHNPQPDTSQNRDIPSERTTTPEPTPVTHVAISNTHVTQAVQPPDVQPEPAMEPQDVRPEPATLPPPAVQPAPKTRRTKPRLNWLNDEDIDLLVQLFPRAQGKRVREILTLLKQSHLVALSNVKRVLYNNEDTTTTSEGSHLYELLRYVTTSDKKALNSEEAPLDLADFVKLLKKAKVPANLYYLPASLKWIGLNK